MGLIKAALSSAGGVLADQWKEYFYCEAIDAHVLALKGKKRNRSGGNNGADNIISNGSVIAVADGQCMMIVEQGKVVDLCAEPGEYTYDISSEPSLLAGGDLADNLLEVFKNIGKRFTFGGETPKDQRVYYFNTKEIVGNKYGTPSPVPFRVVDAHANIDMDIAIRCFGEYSYRITNPMLFYTNVCGNIEQPYTRDRIDSQMKSELLSALQPAFGRVSDKGIRYSSLPSHTTEVEEALNTVLSAKWKNLRGIEIVGFGVSSVKANEEDERMIKELQRTAALKDPDMRAAHYVNATASAMQSAASNESAGPAMAFMGMNMAQNAGGINNAELFQSHAAAAPADSWTCPTCGSVVTGKFCPECGTKRPAPANTWTCPSCGTANKGKFCTECGTKKPAGVPQYKCDKCGWEPADPEHPPKFCPECGDPFDDGDIVG
ncbi:MAG: SPFH domain-containing protein [Oscillospiraceae bacterium]|nr:SPFH domain-containing protein [Oscillospiraceae bacterium]